MRAELLETLGKAAYEAKVQALKPESEFATFTESWQSLDEESKAIYRAEAEAVIHRLAEIAIAPLVHVLWTSDEFESLLKALVS